MLDHRVESIVEPHHRDETRVLPRNDDALTVHDRSSQWLLDIDVFSTPERDERRVGMECRRQRDDDRVHIRHLEHLGVVGGNARLRCKRPRRREIGGVRISNGYHARVRVSAEGTQVRGACDAPATKNAESDRHAVKVATALVVRLSPLAN